MKNQNLKFNKRMAAIKGLMLFAVMLFASTMFGESFSEIGNGIASLFNDGMSSDLLSNGFQIAGSGLATTPFLLNVKGEAFVIKTNEELEKLDETAREKYYAELVEAQSKAFGLLESKFKEKELSDDEFKKQITELTNNHMKTMQTVMKSQGIELDKLKIGNIQLPKGAKAQIGNWIEENAEKINEMHKSGQGFIELTVKAVASMETTSASNPDGIPELVGVQVAPPTNVNLSNSVIDGLVNTITTSLAAYPYTESIPKDGNYDFVLEKGTKPQMDFKIETRYAEPKKIAAYEVLTTESVQDIPGLQSIANDYLRKKHNLKKQNAILFGTGIGAENKGATVYGRAFVAGAMANKVANANIMDVINACITDVYTTPNYQDETPYMPNLAMMNPLDFFIEFVSAKDLNGLPLFPQAGIFNRVTIGGVTIIPFIDIPADKILVCDMSKYNVTNYVGYTVKIGWINDQLITNQFTMVGESRFHAFVKKLDEAAFIYDDISTVKAAILKP